MYVVLYVQPHAPCHQTQDKEGNWVSSASLNVSVELLSNGLPTLDAAFNASTRYAATCPPSLVPSSGLCGMAKFTDLRVDTAGVYVYVSVH
jgi:hypothetical protein